MVLGWALMRWVRHVDSKTGNMQLVYGFRTLVMNFVRELDQTVVDELKKARAATSDGGPLLTEAERRPFARQVVNKLKFYLHLDGLLKVVAASGVDSNDPKKVDGFLHAEVESAVSVLRSEKLLAEAGTVASQEGEATGPFEGVFTPR